MNLLELMSYVQLYTGTEVTKKKIATDVEVTEQALQAYRKDLTKKIPKSWVSLIEQKNNIKLPATRLAHNFVDIQYWNRDKKFAEKLRNSACTQICKDMEAITNGLNAEPKNLEIIAMPSDKMNGGLRPIKHGDILIIDTSLTDISYNGIYFFTTKDDVFVNRIEKKIDRIVFKFDNELCDDAEFSIEELESLNFKVEGRVIHNEWEKL